MFSPQRNSHNNTLPAMISPSPDSSVESPTTNTNLADCYGNRVDTQGNLIDSDVVLDRNGVKRTVERGDIVRILSTRSSSYGKVGHVKGFTKKSIQVHLTNLPNRDCGTALDPKNLQFVCLSGSPRGRAYHNKWRTGYADSSSDGELKEESEEGSVQIIGPEAHRPSGCIIL